MHPIDVVVVAYNSRDRLSVCLEGLVDCSSVHPIVVDNASPDKSYEVVEGLPGVTVVLMPRNGGFSYGCNAGWRTGKAPFVLFLNPDAAITTAQLARLAEALEANDRLGVVGPRIVHDDGTLDFSIRRSPSLRTTYAQALFLHRLFPRAAWTDEIVRDRTAYEQPGPAEWLSGACLLVRRSTLEAIEGFDEEFFLYGEDVDLCLRARLSGFGVGFVPDAVCRHEGGASGPRASLLPVLAASRLKYARKHRSRSGAALERIGIALGEGLRTIVCKGGSDARRGHLRAFAVAATGRDSYRPATSP